MINAKRDLDDLSIELSQISDMLGEWAYNLADQTPRTEIESIIFSATNHIDRIIEDIRKIDDKYDAMKKKLNQPQTLTEETRTIKTLYL